eukprot:4925030-Pyramimonas_sp.AAC.1
MFAGDIFVHCLVVVCHACEQDTGEVNRPPRARLSIPSGALRQRDAMLRNANAANDDTHYIFHPILNYHMVDHTGWRPLSGDRLGDHMVYHIVFSRFSTTILATT